MPKKKPRRGKAAGRRTETERSNSTRPCAPNQYRSALALDLVGFRNRLVAARRRLVERIADDFPADRRFPDSGWSRLLADIQLVIAAVDDVAAEVEP